MLLREKLYRLKWSTNPQTVLIDGYERPIPMPIMPPEHEIRNYRLPTNQQRFVSNPFPRDFKFFDAKKQNNYIHQ